MNHPEAAIQRAIATYLSKVLPADAWFTAIAHGVRHGDGEDAWLRGAISKGMGTKAGVPDILLLYQGRAFFGEVKAPAGSLTEAQRGAHSAITAGGCPVAVWRSVDDARASLAAWGIPTRETKESTGRIRRGFATAMSDQTACVPIINGPSWVEPTAYIGSAYIGFPKSDNLGRKRRAK